MELPRVRLAQLPTPIQRLDRLSELLGIDLWIKRDDLTGFVCGGNKARKLEYILADALARQAQVVVACGAVQSNFVAQLGAACSRFGLECVAATMELPFDAPAGMPSKPAADHGTGNPRLDRLFGVDLQVFPDGDWETLYAHAESLAREFEAQGLRVCRVPVGGSSPLGAYAFWRAGLEVAAQAPPFAFIVSASSSGSTQTGLQAAYQRSQTKVVGIACDPEPDLVNDFAELSAGLADLTGETPVLAPADFWLDPRCVGLGYGVPSEEGWAAIRLMAQTEGILLDPVYSGKAFAGLLAMVGSGEIAGRALFWHTGGLPALFAYPPPAEP